MVVYKRGKNWFTVLMVFILVLVIDSFIFISNGRAGGYQRASLRGLKGIYVLIDGQFDPLFREWLTKDQLRTDVELQLRKAGIKVLTEQEFVTMPKTPHLSITLSASEGACGVSGQDSSLKFYAIGLLIQLHQDAMLERNPKIKINGVTWKVLAVGWNEVKNIKNYTRENLKDGIDIFINDYLAENPK